MQSILVEFVHLYPGFPRKTLVIKKMKVSGLAGISISLPEHNTATVRNIVMVHDRIIEEVSVDCHMQE